MNHYAKCCLTRCGARNRKACAIDVENEDSDDSDSFNLDSVSVDQVQTRQDDWICPILINGSIVPMKLDTGAQVNILSEADCHQLKEKPRIHPTKETLRGYYQGHIPVKGKCILSVKHRQHTRRMTFFIVPGEAQPLLGKSACEKLQLIKAVWAIEAEKTQSEENTLPEASSNIIDEYQDVFQGLGKLPGKHTIVVDPEVTPVVHPSRKVPFALHDSVKAELKRMEHMGVIAAIDQPTDWVNSMVVVKKRNGAIRLCLDPRDLNRAVKREHFKMPTREEIMAQFAGAKYFSKLDAAQGFWQLELDEPSSYLCTFNSPFGRYRYLRLPFGISSAPEVYYKTIHQIFEGIQGVSTIADDIIIHGATKQDHDRSLAKTLEKARQVNLKLNKSKCEVGVKELIFIGDRVTADGVKPDPTKVSAIQDMGKPANKQELQRFMGMVTYLAKWVPGFSQKTAPLRELLQEKNEWQWGIQQDMAFKELKKDLSTEPVLMFYNPRKQVRLSTDASKDGLGAVILQQDEGNEAQWKPVAYASRSLTACEQRYAQIEKELLAIVFGAERFHQFIYGATIQAETDHKPLISLFKKPLNDCPLRVQRLLLRVQRYDLDVTYTPGKMLVVADTLSRAPDKSTGDMGDTETLDGSVQAYVDLVVKTMPVSDERLQSIRAATLSDEQLAAVKQLILNGWPEAHHLCPRDCRPYWNVRAELTVVEDVVYKGMRIVMPSTLRKDMLRKVHEGHMGIEKCRRRARESMYWPNMNSDISALVEHCEQCLKHQTTQQAEPLMLHEIPARPWQKIGVDIATHAGKDYLVVADYYSGYPEVMSLSISSSQSVISALSSILARHGIADVMITDNGPQFTSREFAEFCKDWGIIHQTSSPHYPQSNGLAEATVKVVKNILKKATRRDEFLKGLLAYRATPLANGKAPSQMLMGRRLKTTLPINFDRLLPEVPEDVTVKKERERRRIKKARDRTAKSLGELAPGDMVRVQDHRTGLWSVKAQVKSKVAPRSYEVLTENGYLLRRNRRALRSDPVGHYRQEVDRDLLEERLSLEQALETTVETKQAEVQDTPLPTASTRFSPKSPKPPVRRSTRISIRPKRLIENI